GRLVGYATSAEGQRELYDWLRENPHRLHLGRIGLEMEIADGREVGASDLTAVEQTLDLWTGVLTSRFDLAGRQVLVRTAVHPDQDLLAVSIESSLLRERRLKVKFAFPYGSPVMSAADWKQPEKHQTNIVARSGNRVRLHRSVEKNDYFVAI